MRQTKKHFLSMLILLVLFVAPLLVSLRVSAATTITFRSVTVSSSVPSAVISETFNFNLSLTTPIGSMAFEHCSNSPLPEQPCTPPTGYDSTSRSLTSQTNNTGFTVDAGSSTANRIVITRPLAAGALGATTFGFTNITNTSMPSQTIFVRVSTYASIDGTGVPIDQGSSAYATQGGFSVGAYVPPFLIFCVGITVGAQCSSATGSLISFGELSTSQAKTGTSQFSGATNDFTGYSVFYDGFTMTAGNQAIPALASGGASTPGTSQFGFNLRSNTIPSVGAAQSGAGTSVINANYNIQNIFRMATGEQLTNSTLPTDFNITTVSYLVNISSSQEPGYYATTLTFTAVASF